MNASPSASEFDGAFAKKARGVERRRLGALALNGALFGLASGLVGAIALWRLGFGAERLACAALGALGALGALAGGVVGLRGRWSDTHLALYLDARLKSDETLTTAVAARTAGNSEPALAHVLEQGNVVLRKHAVTPVGPRVFQRLHWLVPVCALGIAFVSRLPLPPRATPGKL
ncbi:MAG TPA: hypothetical protein VGM29_06940, partial [Polyangiaceae bacterium]